MADDLVPLPDEMWKPVPEFPDYEVSDFGRVRSLPRKYLVRHPRNASMTKSLTFRGRLIGRCRVSKSGHKECFVTLYRDKCGFEIRIHRLVLLAFVGPCPSGKECCHNNGDSTDNRLINLRGDTHVANMEDSRRHGTMWLAPVYYGASNSEAKLTPAAVREIRAAQIRHGTKTQLARKFGVSTTTITNVLNGKAWKYESGIRPRSYQD